MLKKVVLEGMVINHNYQAISHTGMKKVQFDNLSCPHVTNGCQLVTSCQQVFHKSTQLASQLIYTL